MSRTSSTLVLVPGAWQGGWVWQPVARRLRAAGHEVVTLTMPGPAAKTPGPTCSFPTPSTTSYGRSSDVIWTTWSWWATAEVDTRLPVPHTRCTIGWRHLMVNAERNTELGEDIRTLRREDADRT
ncbi:alpha/beta fold hydrolase [Streptomyces sp. NPDC001351]|uniref:alpha/beta fold hydrolase n=1 Tax=Streptomyces sp. NPDC001351 TaxID=3364564 RepID=UPI0036CF3AF1